MISRTITDALIRLSSKFPVLTLTGARQVGKSTLLKDCFKEYKYISFEDPDIRQVAIEDPRGFLNSIGTHCILDEAQRVPEIFSYIQTKVDSVDECGQYIISGSHNFLLMERITQSLAGRVAVLKLFPLSVQEMTSAGILPHTIDSMLYTGGYPRVYDKNIAPNDYFPSYLQTYVERDVRLLRNITDESSFIKFVRLCAGRVGQVLDVTSLANDGGISVPTAKSWLSILETSYIIFMLSPYYKNYNKRLIKSPKIYFYDTGLLSSLLGMNEVSQMSLHYLRGNIFENMVVSEAMKRYYTKGQEPHLYYYRDSNGNEVDLLDEDGGIIKAYEIKSSETMNQRYFDGLKKFSEVSGIPQDDMAVIYGGDMSFKTEKGRFLSWKQMI